MRCLCFAGCSFGLRWDDVGTQKPNGTPLDSPALDEALLVKSMALDTCGVNWKEVHSFAEISKLRESDRISDPWLENELCENDKRTFRPKELSEGPHSTKLSHDSWVKVQRKSRNKHGTRLQVPNAQARGQEQGSEPPLRASGTRGLKWKEFTATNTAPKPHGVEIVNRALSTALLVCICSYSCLPRLLCSLRLHSHTCCTSCLVRCRRKGSSPKMKLQASK